MDSVLLRAIEARLHGETSLSDAQKLLVLAACEGNGELERVLDGDGTVEAPTGEGGGAGAPPDPAGAYLRSVEVQGFRGVGPATKLTLEPGPGLTLVVGRNGSGKSSFAEALEVLFTGENKRWSDRAAVWKDGWRNLHHEGEATIEAELVVEGEARRVVARRAWAKDAPIDGGVAQVHRSGDSPGPLSELGWEQALASYRPFLSYNELGSMLDEGPSRLFDAMTLILGLDDVADAMRTLADAYKVREVQQKQVKARLSELLSQLGALDGDRARRCHIALSKKAWDFDAVADVLRANAGSREGDDRSQQLRKLENLEPPARIEMIEALVRDLREAQAQAAAVVGSDAAVARETAELLEAALAFHAHHRVESCPVCGTPGALSNEWAAQSRLRASVLREQAMVADDAHGRARDARSSAQQHMRPPPECLERGHQVGVDTTKAIEIWTRWSSPPDSENLEAVAAHLESTILDLCEAVQQVSAAARAQLEQRELAWRPIARSLEDWLPDARAVTARVAQVRDLKVAGKWLKDAAADIRSDRFQPIADETRRVFGELRSRSSVDLVRVTLEGTGNRRRVDLEVQVDDVPGAALGVMSQGELHSLALSLFLPRATLPESPFRFLVIDDPVQSMDLSRVDGLARVLDEVARSRQVVVFTHDDRLPSAIRDLGIEARVIEVTRRARSVIELRQSCDPVTRYLEDARALAATDDLPGVVGRRLVPGFCRQALEAACTESVRRRLLREGLTHGDVETRIAGAESLTRLAALALFGDSERGGDVLTAINKLFKRSAGDVYQACNKGMHQGHDGNLRDLVNGTAALASELRNRQ